MGSFSVLETCCFLLGNKVILWDQVVSDCLFDLYQLYLFELESKKWSLGFAIFWHQHFLRELFPSSIRLGVVDLFPILSCDSMHCSWLRIIFLIYSRDLANIIFFNQPLDLISTDLLWAWFKWYAASQAASAEPYQSLLQGRSWGSYLMWSWYMVYWSMKSSQVTKSELHWWDKFEMHHVRLIMRSFSCIFFFRAHIRSFIFEQENIDMHYIWMDFYVMELI